ncbi:MAG: HAD family phosphatase [Rikenellaceae bacterium]
MQTKLLLIDFDGTLVDTRQAHYRSYRDALREVCNVELNEHEYLSTQYGMRFAEFMHHIGVTDSALTERVRLRKIELYPTHFEMLRLNSWLYDLVVDFKRNGGKAWIVSAGQGINISNAMKHLGIEELFDGIITGGDVANCKPAPDPFLQAMAAEDCTPEECLIFEDSVVGLESAKASGAPYIRVAL